MEYIAKDYKQKNKTAKLCTRRMKEVHLSSTSETEYTSLYANANGRLYSVILMYYRRKNSFTLGLKDFSI